MRKNQILFIILIPFLLSGFYACEFEISGINEVDISKPNNTIPVSITLPFESDSIIIYQKSTIDFSLNTFGKKCNAVSFQYLNKEAQVYFNNEGGILEIDPDFTLNNWFDLKATYYLGSGSGSIADYFKAENYVGTKTWKVKFMKLSDIKVPLQSRLSKDSLLELFWVKPKYIPVINSQLYFNSFSMNTYTKADTTVYTINDFCYGSIQPNISIQVDKNNYISSSLNIDYPVPELHILLNGPDSSRLFLKSPIRMNYKIAYGQNSYTVKKSNTVSLDVKNIAFPIELRFDVTFFPYFDSIFDIRYTNYSNWKYITALPGIAVPPTVAYCKSKDILYGYDNDNYGSSGYKTFNFPLSNDYTNSYGVSGLLSCNNTGSLIVVEGTFFMNVFKNGPTTGLSGYPTELYNTYTRLTYVQPTDNDCIGFYSNYNNTKKYTLKNYGYDLTWFDFSFTPDYIDSTAYYYSGLALTMNGRYLCSLGSSNFNIYDLNNHTSVNKIFSIPKTNILSVINNPIDPNQILVKTKTGIEVRQCPDFNLISTYNDPELSGLMPVNVDPYSGILFATNPGYFKFIRLSDMKLLFKLSAAYYPNANSARLFHNYIFSSNRALNLTNYFK
ncbi:MAG: hypothetical protein PHT07_23695 [Paludibacter sp.]|nr:hypothetical protein [Paludibacter sp.]